MATVVLQYAGQAIGTLLGGPLGGLVGRAAGAVAGNFFDQQIFGSKKKVEGPRLNDLRVMASEEGAAIPSVWGRMRVAGQVIWATRLLEQVSTSTEGASSKGGGGGSGGGTKITRYTYAANFAVGLCEGEMDRIGRVWADGREVDISGYTYRFYSGSQTQLPDSLITAYEGAGQVPAYRGLCYLVFEHLPLADFGNRLPQLSFELIRAGNDAADGVQAVCIIPGATEFGYDTTRVTRDVGSGHTASENAHVSRERSDFSVAIDQLQGACKNVDYASLVVAWFGTDLRCGSCEVKPGVESASKVTTGSTWTVSGTPRNATYVLSQSGAGPAFGGTPSDGSVKRAITDLKARGLKVMFYPFVMMDIAAGNALPDPYGGAAQASYPWRGRMTASLAPGQPGTPDKTATATTQVNNFLGTATPAQFTASGDTVIFSGSAQWSYRRMILHYAKLCAAAGGVDAFLIGSEMRGLTGLRGASNSFPFVTGLITLAAEVKAILPGAKISYAADWSEYFGYQPSDASNDLFFHLDPLWAAASIDFIGIDNYVPLSDWRDGRSHLDATGGISNIYDVDYLAAGNSSGEGYDWYYASPAARDAQTRTAITDGAYNKPWVFRPKDLKNWWLNPHFNRPAGVQSGVATAWVPQSKPFWFTELGCPAIDKGTNQPNVFYDAKSSESAVPHYSGGQSDELMQNRYMLAMQTYWNGPASNNPISSVYGGKMLDTGRMFFWAFDARPFPVFPARTDIWADGENYSRGHWLNGRLEAVDLQRLCAELLSRFGLTQSDTTQALGLVDGFLLDRPMSGREALDNLLQIFTLDAIESDGQLKLRHRSIPAVTTINAGDCVDPGPDKTIISATRAQETDLPHAVRLGYAESGLDYRNAAVAQRRASAGSAREIYLTLPAAVSQSMAQARTDVALAEAWSQRTGGQFALPPTMLALEPGDVVAIGAESWRLASISDATERKIESASYDASVYDPPPSASRLAASREATAFGAPDAVLMDLALTTHSGLTAPWIAAQATPWPGALALLRQTGSSFTLNKLVTSQATMGQTLTDLPTGRRHVVDFSNSLDVVLNKGALASITKEVFLDGGNVAAIGTPGNGFEIIQFLNASLIAANTYRLTGLSRALAGSAAEMLSIRSSGQRFVLLNGAVSQVAITLAEAGLNSAWRVGPQQFDHGHSSYVQIDLPGTLKSLRPLAPVRLKSINTGAGVSLNWIRQTRVDGDSWELTEVPMVEAVESYRLTILDGSVVKRTVDVATPNYLYTTSAMTADFGTLPANFSARIQQLSASVGAGSILEKVINV